MKLRNRYEKWVGTDGSYFWVRSGPEGVAWLLQIAESTNWSKVNAYFAADWAGAEKAAREAFESWRPGMPTELSFRTWHWVQEEPGESRYHEITWTKKAVSWRVGLDRGRGDGYAIYHHSGSSPTWEGAIEAGSKVLDALATMPVPS